jgi:hypothetical protein
MCTHLFTCPIKAVQSCVGVLLLLFHCAPPIFGVDTSRASRLAIKKHRLHLLVCSLQRAHCRNVMQRAHCRHVLQRAHCRHVVQCNLTRSLNDSCLPVHSAFLASSTTMSPRSSCWICLASLRAPARAKAEGGR